MNKGIFKRPEISYEKHLRIIFYEYSGKSNQDSTTIILYPKSAAFTVCKSSHVKNCMRSSMGLLEQTSSQ